MKQAADENSEEQSFAFIVSECELVGLKQRGFMVNTGATSWLKLEIRKFLRFDESFQPTNPTVEPAHGTRTNGLVLRRGNA